jgi:RNA polymerase sigma-B factor
LLSQRQDDHRLFLESQLPRNRRDREVLIERFLPLARSLARRYQRGPESLEDLEQVACLALVKTIDSFDPSRGAAFSRPSQGRPSARRARSCAAAPRVTRRTRGSASGL